MAADVQHTFGAAAICTDGPYGPVPRAAAGSIALSGGLRPSHTKQEAEERPPPDINRPGR